MIRDLRPEDRAAFLQAVDTFYHSEAVLHSVPRENFETTFDLCLTQNPYARGVAFEVEGQFAGYALLSLSYSNEVGGMVVWLEEAFIHPQYRGHGLGHAFFRWVEQEYGDMAKRYRLEVTHANTRAIALYERLGYEVMDYVQMVKEK